MATTKGYATTAQLVQILGLEKTIPSWDVGGTPSKENVGTGNNSTTLFYLDHQAIIEDSYALYSGATEAAAVVLTKTTDYAINLTTGLITLTGAGVTAVGTDIIYAEYSYASNEMTDIFLEEVLNRAEGEVDMCINSTFTDGTATNPTYPAEIEVRYSEGSAMDVLISFKKPLIDVASALDGAHTDSQNTIDLTAGTGANFPATGNVLINSEAVSYTGVSTDQLTGVTRGILGTTAAAHSDGDAVHTTMLFSSNTTKGTAATFTIQPWDMNTHADEFGVIYSFQNDSRLSVSGVANRYKIYYYHGYNTIPAEITRLTLLFAKRQLIQDNIGKAMIAGRNEFKPEMFNTDKAEMDKIINGYIVLSMGNT